MWTIIKQVINKKKSSKTHDKFMYNNRKITDPQTIADGFNNYFVNIGPTLASKIPDNDLSHKEFLPENITTSLFLNPRISKNIKHIKESMSFPLTNMINLSFEQGVFPSELKFAVITPLYKAKDPMFFNNYRPISLLSMFSKIIQRLMYNRLPNFINRHKIFNQNQ